MQINLNHLESARNELSALGFTGLEAEIYIFLLMESPATGYRAAQALKKPVANTYKSIQALERKGAVIVEEGANRLCRPVPIEELLALIDREHQQHHTQAEQLLRNLLQTGRDDRIYQLTSAQLVYERARTMLRSAKVEVLVNAFPNPLRELSLELATVAASNVQVSALVYQAEVIRGMRSVHHPSAKVLFNGITGSPLTVVVDGQEFLNALFSDDGSLLLYGIWSKSVHMAMTMHRQLLSEINLSDIINRYSTANSFMELRTIISEYAEEKCPRLPGWQLLSEKNHG